MLDRLAEKITSAVSTMWCALVFAGLALIALPSAIHGGTLALVQWVSQTFIQLVMLSILAVGQRLQEQHAHRRHAEQLAQHDHTHHSIHRWLLETITDDTSDD